MARRSRRRRRDPRRSARPPGVARPVAGDSSGQSRPLGPDVGASDGVPSFRRLLGRARRDAREPLDQRLHPNLVKWVALAPLPWPPGIPTRPRDRSMSRSRDEAGGLRRGPRWARRADRALRRPREPRARAASALRPDDPRRLAPLGLPPRGSPPAPVRRLTLRAQPPRILSPPCSRNAASAASRPARAASRTRWNAGRSRSASNWAPTSSVEATK